MAQGRSSEVEARGVIEAWWRSGLSLERFAKQRGFVSQRLRWCLHQRPLRRPGLQQSSIFPLHIPRFGYREASSDRPQARIHWSSFMMAFRNTSTKSPRLLDCSCPPGGFRNSVSPVRNRRHAACIPPSPDFPVWPRRWSESSLLPLPLAGR